MGSMWRWLFGPLDPKTRWILAAGAAVRLTMLGAGAPRLDRAFVVDDAYYTLTIAREFARSGLPSADGVEMTTGFQPLLALLELPAFLVGASPDHGLLWALAIGLASDWLIAVLLARLAALGVGGSASLVVAGIWSLSPVAITEALVGLEGPLATAMTLLAVAFLHELNDKPSRRIAAWAGVSLGLCLLARIDTAFFVALAGSWILWRHRSSFLYVTAIVSLVAGPWLGFCAWQTGRPWPESGTAVGALVGEGNTVTSLARCAGWAAGYVIPGGLVDVPELRDWLVQNPIIGALAVVVAMGLGGLVAMRLPVPARIWVFGTISLMLFYLLVLPAIWGFHRYLLPARVAGTLILAIVFVRLLERIASSNAVWLRRAGLVLLSVNLLLMLVGALGAPARGGIDRSTGYRTAALAVHSALPSGATVGGFQTGALGYFRPPDAKVVNLDGVVSRSAHLAFVSRTLDRHMKARGVTHLSEWKVGLREISSRTRDGKPSLRVLFVAEPQGNYRFVLAELSWPPQ